MTQTIHVAVVSWNTRDLLARCVESLHGHAVTVVDNGSTDGSPDVVPDWATLIEPGENLGFGRAVNLAVEQGPRTPWIGIANADVELEPGAMEALLAGARPQTGALAPRLVLPDGSTQHSVHSFPTVPFTAAFNLGLARFRGDALCLEGAWDAEIERNVPWAIGAFLLVRREAWEAVGGFDETQWMYAEDLDLGWRLACAGWRTRYVPSARVRHASGASTQQAWAGEEVERWLTASYAWQRRRRGTARALAFGAANLAGAGARWAVGAKPGRETWARWVRAHRAAMKGVAR